MSALPKEYLPSVGERVEIVYQDAVMDNMSIALGCTLSVTAEKPTYFATGTRHVTAWHHFNKSGCSGSYDTAGDLEWHEFWGYTEKALNTYTMPSSIDAVSYVTIWDCNNSNSTTWRAQSWFGFENDGAATSATLTAACG